MGRSSGLPALRVAVVGGGIAGLACAEALRGAARVTLLEGSGRWGGQILTRRREGFLVEAGAESLHGLDPVLDAHLRDLGVDLQPVLPGPGAAVRHAGRLHPLPPGLAFGIPDRPGAFLGGRLLSLRGKLRMGLDLVLPRGRAAGDRSLGGFLRRRLGDEAVERIAEPVLAGIHLARADELSLEAVHPRLAGLGREHRSLFLGLRRTPPPLPPRAPREGMGSLVERMLAAMPEVEARTGVPVRRVRRAGAKWRVEGDGGGVEADQVVLAVPAPEAAAMLGAEFGALAAALGTIPYRSCATVTFGFRGSAPGGFSSVFLEPGSGDGVVACMVTSLRYEGRAPEGCWSIRCFLRGVPGDAVGTAFRALEGLLGPLPEPGIAELERWPGSRPVYTVGHPERVREIERRTPPGLHLCGSAYRGGGVPDCLADARRTAGRILGS